MQTSSRLMAFSLALYLLLTVSGRVWGSEWYLEGGPVFRGGMRARMNNRPTFAQSAGLLPAATGGNIGVPDYSGGPNFVRVYDNGYVGKDPGTGVSPIDPNTTWNWGFDNAGQYQGAAGTLGFLKQNAPLLHRSDDMLGIGLQLVAGMPLKKGEKCSLDLTFGFQGTWGAEANLSEKITGTVDTYDVSATVADGFNFSTAAGHRGTFLGPFDTPAASGAVIPYIPTRAPGTFDTVGLSVSQSLYQFSLGPQLSYDVESGADRARLKVYLRPTVSANIQDVDVSRDEVFTAPAALGGGLMRWSNSASRQAVYFGLGISGGAQLELGNGFFAGIFGGYEWVAESLQVKVGPNTVSVDASGFVAGAVLGKRF